MSLPAFILAIALALLWRRVRALNERIGRLERGVAGPASAAPQPAWTAETIWGAAAGPDRREAPDPLARIAAAARASLAALSQAAPKARRSAGRRGGARFEHVFGRRLPIWAGGATLAVAGIATLYATTLAASGLYRLVGPGAAFAGMALVTVLAGLLSVRFGAPSAVLGLVGGLAAPALAGAAQPDIPLLALYLVLAVGGLCALGCGRGWGWLAATALAGGFGWGALLIVRGALDLAGSLSVGAYVLALGIGLPALLEGGAGRTARLAAAAMACAQLAALVAVGGFAPLHWGLFGLVSAAIVWLSRREALFADAPAPALCVAILLGLAWPRPGAAELGRVLAGLWAVFGLPAAWRVWRAGARRIDAPSIAALGLATGLLPSLKLPGAATAPAALLAAGLVGAVAARGWRAASRRADARFAVLSVAAAALLAVAAERAGPDWSRAPAVALIGLGLYLVGERGRDRWPPPAPSCCCARRCTRR